MLNEKALFTYKLQYPILLSIKDGANQYQNITVQSIDILQPKIKHLQTLIYSIDGLADDFSNYGLFNNIRNDAMKNPDYGQSEAMKIIVEIVKHTTNAEAGVIKKKMEDSFISLITCSPDNDGSTLCRVNEKTGNINAMIFLQSKDFALLNGIDFKELNKLFFYHYCQIAI